MQNIEEIRKMYLEDVASLENELMEEGFPSHGSTYEVRLSAIQSLYPELFGDDEEEEKEWEHIFDMGD